MPALKPLFFKGTCRLLSIGLVCAASYSYGAEPMQDQALTPLFDGSAGRLQIARHVVLAKWDSHQATDDPTRGAVVISTAANQALAQGWSGALPPWSLPVPSEA